MRRLKGLTYPDDGYLLALGEAVMNFGLVELGAVNFVELREPGFYAKSYDMTAVPIMHKFRALAEGDKKLESIADKSLGLAVRRNSLLYARPVAGEGEQPRLSYAGKEGFIDYRIEEITEFSRHCVSVIAFFGDWASEMSEPGTISQTIKLS